MSTQISIASSVEQAGVCASERRALVVDDDAGIVALTTAILRRHGFTVKSASNGRDAVTLLGQDQFELIIVDLAMPHMNGIELLEYLSERMPPTLRRIVVLTASLHMLQHGLPDGVCRVLTKPFELDDFVAAIQDCAVEP
jgi:CheY-like chemotaxis protein